MKVEEYPKLRHGLEALPVEHQGRTMILVRDQWGLSGSTLLFSPPTAQLLNHMNGRNSLRDLQACHARLTGELLYMEQLEEVLRHLDESLFLENDRFIRASMEQVVRFQRDPLRRMMHAGKSYSSEPQELGKLLDSFFLPENQGPGVPSGSKRGKIWGIVSPHIDINAGGPSYAHVYKTILESHGPQTWVILGTGHNAVDNYLAVTLKDFETPFGNVPCDRDYGTRLLERAPRDLLASEYSHHREHTIEFQALFLGRYLPGTRLVPILCSFSLEDWERDQGYLDELSQLLWELGESHDTSVGFMASVDLAHIGPRYGDGFRPGDGHVSRHLSADLELLKTLEDTDAAGFMKKLGEERNSRRICGMAPLYVLARVLEGRARGRTLHHGHAVVDPHGSFVTFAGMAFQ